MRVGYYKILDIEHTATEDEIKKAFRKLAHIYHPDKPTGHLERFKIINECYQTLMDREKRRRHDIEAGLIRQPMQQQYIIYYGNNGGFYGSGTTSTSF